MRSALSLVVISLVTAAATCDDVGAPEPGPPNAFTLRSVDGEALPLVVERESGETVTLTASTLQLSDDGAFETVATFHLTPADDWPTWTTLATGMYEWSGDDLVLRFADGTSDHGTWEPDELTLESGGSRFRFGLIEAPFALEEAYSLDALGDGFLRQFAFTSDGSLWAVSSHDTILRRWGGETTTWDAAGDLGATAAADLFIAPDDRVWVALGSGFAVHDGQGWTHHDAPAAMTPGTTIRRIAVNAVGDVLLAAGVFQAGGLLLRHATEWIVFTPENSALPTHITHDLSVDDAGRFWVGSAPHARKSGLTRISDGAVEVVYSVDSGLLAVGADIVAAGGSTVVIGYGHALREDWPGADGGIQRLDPATGALTAAFPATTGLLSSRIKGLLVTDEGEVWFTTGIDEARPTCVTCFSGVGRLLEDGHFEVLSSLNYDLEVNQYLVGPVQGPDGAVYVATERTIFRVTR